MTPAAEDQKSPNIRFMLPLVLLSILLLGLLAAICWLLYPLVGRGVRAVSYTHLDVYKRQVLDRAYFENATLNQQIPVEVVPQLRKQSIPVHQVVPVDVFVPGCPPSADNIFYALTELLAGRTPELRTRTHFGA